MAPGSLCTAQTLLPSTIIWLRYPVSPVRFPSRVHSIPIPTPTPILLRHRPFRTASSYIPLPTSSAHLSLPTQHTGWQIEKGKYWIFLSELKRIRSHITSFMNSGDGGSHSHEYVTSNAPFESGLPQPYHNMQWCPIDRHHRTSCIILSHTNRLGFSRSA